LGYFTYLVLILASFFREEQVLWKKISLFRLLGALRFNGDQNGADGQWNVSLGYHDAGIFYRGQ
jgi:hypothetical protein